MKMTEILRLNSDAVHRHIYPAFVGNFVARALFSGFNCAITRRHLVVPRLTFCFRCGKQWEEWSDIPARTRRRA